MFESHRRRSKLEVAKDDGAPRTENGPLEQHPKEGSLLSVAEVQPSFFAMRVSMSSTSVVLEKTSSGQVSAEVVVLRAQGQVVHGHEIVMQFDSLEIFAVHYSLLEI